MATVSKKENLTIAIREYTNGQGETKKVWKTIGELVTWDDGKQSFEMWGQLGQLAGACLARMITVASNSSNNSSSNRAGINRNNKAGTVRIEAKSHYN